MPTVYIVQDPDGRNIEPARQFGELVVILNGKEGVESATKKLSSHLDEITNNDYLLLIGNPVNIGIATFMALTVLGGRA